MNHLFRSARLRRIAWGLFVVALFFCPGDRLILPSEAQSSINAGTGSCYGNDLPPGVVVNIDPTTGGCFPQQGTRGAPNVVSDNFEGTKATYSVAVTGLVTAATATDIFTLDASSTKLVRLLQAQVTCTGTAVTVPVTIVKRSTLATAGTAQTLTITPNDPADGVATAVAKTWTANPTVGALVGAVRATSMSVNAAAAVNPPTSAAFAFGMNVDKAMVLAKASTQEIAINFNSTTITTPLCTLFAEWSEE